MRLTDITFRALKAPERGQRTYTDETLPGFGVRVSQGGTKTFVVVHGVTRERTTIGRFPVISLAEARTEARRLLAERTLGRRRPKTPTYDAAKIEFLEHCEKTTRPRTHADYTRLLKRFAFGATKLAEITKQDIKKRLKRMDDTPSEQAHALVALKVFFNWCVRQEYLDYSPCAGLRASQRPRKRQHALTPEELGQVLSKALLEPFPFGPIVVLLILTGQRRGEIAKMEWEWVDRTSRTVALPGSVTKNHRDHLFPYGAMAEAVLDALPRIGNAQYLFPSAYESIRGKPATVFNGWSKSKKAFDKKLEGVRPYRLHDLRRTLATRMSGIGVQQITVEKLLNHISGGEQSEIASVYNVYDYLPEKRDAVERYEEFIVRLLKK